MFTCIKITSDYINTSILKCNKKKTERKKLIPHKAKR